MQWITKRQNSRNINEATQNIKKKICYESVCFTTAFSTTQTLRAIDIMYE